MTMATRNHMMLLEYLRRLEVNPDRREAWQQRALCAQVGGDLWHPERGGSTKEAKGICADCPVRLECKQYALDNDERYGIWGGLSERERRRLKTASTQPTDTGLCGTSQGYQKHRRRGEQACVECRQAASRRSRADRELKPPTVLSSCSTAAGTKAHSRRGERSCQSCLKASTVARRQRRRTA